MAACQGRIEAVEIFRKRPGGFDIVITDMSMPKMSGMAFSQAVRAIRPDIPIVLCTGYAPASTPEKGHAIPVQGLPIKAMRFQTLATSVRQAINGGQISSR